MDHPAFYRLDGETYVPTPACIGPWDPELQHGGPPSALLAGLAERFGDETDAFTVVRITVELLRPVPMTPLRCAVRPLRLGRQAQWLEGTIEAGKPVARATILRVRREAIDLPPTTTPPEAPPSEPGQGEPFVFPFFPVDDAYHTAIEMRLVAGPWGEGPATAWLRPRIPLVEGRTSSALERTLIVADATNGVAPALSTDDFAFINPDLTVHLQRAVEGEWLALEARSVPEASGMGLVQSGLYDERGEVGRCLQSLVIRRR